MEAGIDILSNEPAEAVLSVLELATSVAALISNALLLSVIASARSASIRTHSSALCSLSLAQFASSCLSLIHSATGPKWRMTLRNASFGFFIGGCVTGAAAVNWINWWSLVRMDNPHLPSSHRLGWVISCVLWFGGILLVSWLQLVDRSIPVAGSIQDGRMVLHYARLYSVVFILAAGWVLFSNLTYVPSVEIPAEAVTLGRKLNHDCNADCICSDSDGDFIPTISKRVEVNQNPSGIPVGITDRVHGKASLTIPTIVTHQETGLVLPGMWNPESGCSQLSSVTSLRDYVLNHGAYSGDVSTNSPFLTPKFGPKLTTTKLNQRLEHIQRNRWMEPRPSTASVTNSQLRPRRPRKRAKSVIKKPRCIFIRFRKPNSYQMVGIVAFVGLYSIPWLMLVSATVLNDIQNGILGVVLIWINCINLINPLWYGFRYPGLQMRIAKILRKIRPKKIDNEMV